ncbi:MAG: hypothetical protein KAJ51_12200 [Thermoplasmata archaeon]|nr:hypothetical protein [Thermoplasmata archaeon]
MSKTKYTGKEINLLITQTHKIIAEWKKIGETYPVLFNNTIEILKEIDLDILNIQEILYANTGEKYDLHKLIEFSINQLREIVLSKNLVPNREIEHYTRGELISIILKSED